MSDTDRRALEGLRQVALRDPMLAAAVTGAGWFAEEWGAVAMQALIEMGVLASRDLEAARYIAALPWFPDGLAREESDLISALARLASRSGELARAVPGLAWVADGVTPGEPASLHAVAGGSFDLGTARALLELPWSGDLRSGVARALDRSEGRTAGIWREVARQPWFRDGLTREDATRVMAVGLMARDGEDELLTALLGEHDAQFAAASLPLTGTVHVAVYQTAPFEPGEEIALSVGEMARHIEAFAGAPLPTTEILVLVQILPEGLFTRGYGGFHRRDYLVVNRLRSDTQELTDGVLAHELSHYYRYEPKWLSESVADLMKGYVGGRTGGRGLGEYLHEEGARVVRDCAAERVSTVRHALAVDESRGGGLSSCTRAVGTFFLHQVIGVMGEQGLAAALRELRALAAAPQAVDEEVIFSTLLGHTPAEWRERFTELYLRYHGQPPPDPGARPPDDHGSTSSAATRIEVGETIAASLDYTLDVDRFRFRATAGRKYRVELGHASLGHSSLLLLPRDAGPAGLQFRRTEPAGPSLVWVAPRTAWYELEVTNWGGGASPYTLRVSPIADAADDHGDSAETATYLGGGELLPGEGDNPPYLYAEGSGTIDSDSDLDYFRFSLVPGKSYYLGIEGAGPTRCCLSRTNPGQTVAGEFSLSWWFQHERRELVVVAHGHPEHVGPYIIFLAGHDD